MSTSKRILSFIMALAMVMTMFSGVGVVFASAAEETYYTGSESVGIDTLADFAALGYDKTQQKFYMYLGVDYYEQNAAGEWELTDHYVQPGAQLRGEVHFKTNMYTGSGMAIYFNFDRNFFDITNGKGATYPATANSYDPDQVKYPTENYPYNIAHDANDGAAINGDNPIVSAEEINFKYTTKWARNVPGFKEQSNANFHGIALSESDEWDLWYVNVGTGTVNSYAFEFETDEYFFTFDVKVREFMPDGVTKLADGTVGSVTLDKRCWTIYDNAAHAGTNTASRRVGNIGTYYELIKESSIKRMNLQNWFTIDDFYTDDCNHTFTIGKPTAAGKEHTATFTVDGETYGDALTVKEGAEIAAPATAPVKAGYTFKGWALDGTTTVLEFPQTMGTEDVTYVAIFEALPKFTATFLADGVQVGEVKEYYEGETIEAPASPTKLGYNFVGWEPEVGEMGSADVVFNAVFEAKTYTATWIVDGEEYDTTTATFDAAYELPTEPSLEGKTFAGWYADASFATSIADKHTVDADVTFYAKFTTDVFTITFDTDGGSPIAPVEYAYGATVVAPTAPTKTGYTFAGWSPELPTTMPANNVTVVAQWTAVASGAYFYDGDSLEAEIPGVYGDVITVAQVPVLTKLGYTFKGWFDADGNEVTFPYTLGIEALTVYAVWTPIDLYIEFYNGDEWLTGSNQSVGSAIVTPDAPSKTGYEFVGWVDEDGNAMPDTVPAAAAGTQFVYFATFRAEMYEAVFMNGDEVYDTFEGVYQSAITAPADPEMEGYTFQYWAKQGTTAKVDFTKAKMPLNGVTYVAIYKINSYTVTYFIDDVQVWQDTYEYGAAITPYTPDLPEGTTFSGFGEIPATMPAENLEFRGQTGVASYTVTFTINGEEYKTLSFGYGAAVTAPAYDIPEGYSFSGWDLPAAMPAENITLDASLTINKYWARFWLDEEKTQLYHEVEVTYGEEIEFPEDPTEADIPGHTFDIWDDDTITTMPAYNVDYVAITNKIPYTIAFLNEDGSAIDGAEWIGYYGDVITEDDAPVVTKEGFEFKGWTVNGEKVTLPYTVKGDTTFTASFGVVAYEVIWYVDGKEVYRDTYDFGDAIVMRADEVKEGYTFSGWDTDLTGMTMPAEDIEVNGTFTVNVYDALFYADGELIETVPTNFGEIPAAPKAPEKTGYAFIGWAPALAPMVVAPEGVRYDAVYSAGAVAYTVEIYTMDTEGVYGAPETLTMSANADAAISYAPAAKTGFTVDADASVLEGTAAADGSSVLKVYYIRDQYDFTIIVDGEATTETYYYDEAVTAPADPVKEGYDFIGWDGTVPTTMPARDVTLTARFVILQFTITFVTDGGTTITPIKADYGTAVVAPADPTKTGYTFDGWDKEIPKTIPAEDVTITAKWTINQYTITFANTGDTVIDDIKQDYNTAVTAPADPEKLGYTFTGWDVEVPKTMPAENITITATWKVNQYPATFIIDGKTETVATNFGEVPVAPEAVKYGYTFTSWDVELAPMGVDGATYTAVFAANKYDATFDAAGGKWADGETVKYDKDVEFDSAITAPAEDPTKEGYIFAGWTPAVGDMTVEGGMTFTATWTQDLDFCRVQSVTRVTEKVYGPQLANYEIKVMGSPVKIQLCYADATSVTWTFDRNDAKVDADGASSGLVKVETFNAGTDEAYEIWTIRTVLTEDNYKVRAKVDYTSSSWESLEFAFDYTVVYDVEPVATTMVYEVTASAASVQRGKQATITVVTDASVSRLQLRMQKADGTYTTVTYAPTSSAVSYDDATLAAENKATWAITITFTYSGTAESQTQTWEVWYRVGTAAWADSEKSAEVKVTRLAVAAPVAPGEQAPYSVISVEIAEPSVKVATEVKITVVTTNDITRVRLNNTELGKTATYLKTSKNLVLTENAEAGTYTWEITYRFGIVSDNQQWFAQCRGTSWSALEKSFTVNVTE